ncbi:MAG: hypothetical protein J0I20_33450 [Chloroflexi bacterium]|nr:hypothetical protein [Chloroflexota bacterium]OJV91463.1 MAG: hypothetical protein BGO39_21710 [Chloroflexi bacterium 54-19]
MPKELQPTTPEPDQPPTAPEEGELRDEELDTVTGGEKNVSETMQMISNILKQQQEIQKAIIRNLG